MAKPGVASMYFVLLTTQALLCLASGRNVDASFARSLLANPVSAGSPCNLNDLCSGSPNDPAGQQYELCPVDPKTKVGVCPPVMAGFSCVPGDLCATSATTSALCPAVSDDSSQSLCPDLALGATCSALAGSCNDTQACTARPPNAYAVYDPTVGVCSTYITAGAACKAGYDVCSIGNYDWTDVYCSASPCTALRPGSGCWVNDLCRFGADSDTTKCPVAADSVSSDCPAQATDGACLVGDDCTSPQVCSAVGDAAGTCVDLPTLAYGATCTSTEYCLTTAIATDGSEYPSSAVLCPAGKCPLASAGNGCTANKDTCNTGSGSGVLCTSSTGGTSGTCPVLAAGAACSLIDTCGPDAAGNTQQCNAQGTAQGVCVTPIAAGMACTAKSDVCSPTYDICTSGTCPQVPAGQDCYINDICSSGTTAGVACAKSADSNSCPILTTGLACTANDLCVRGASCVGAKDDGSASGVCTPNIKGTAKISAVVFSNATMVPAVTSIATLGSYGSVAAFNSTEQTRFINTLEANILAQINAVTNVTITKVTLGSINVANSVAFTDASNSDAVSGQSALATLLASQDGVSSIFGTTFGSVTVSNVTRANSTNPTVQSGSVTTGLSLTMGIAVAITALMMSL